MNTPIYGLLLAGGKSERMGQDKALLRLDSGETQLERSVSLLHSVCPKVFVSMRKDKVFPIPSTAEPLFDSLTEISGPLCGILSAMRKHPEAHWLVIACDLPNLSTDVLNKLIQNFNALPSPFYTAYRSSYDALPEPLCAIYPAGSDNALYALAKEIGKVCPRKLLILKEAILIDQADPTSLDNINTQAELAQHLSSKQS